MEKSRGGRRTVTCEDSEAGLSRWPLSQERGTSNRWFLGDSQQEQPL